MAVRPISISQIRSEFDEFLYAPIDEGGNGIVLSVLSALARLDIDPWREAGNLARMSQESATQRLASLISALPGGPPAHLDTRTIAARLIALLPRRHSINIAPREMPPGVDALNRSRAVMYLFIINVTFFTIMLASQYFTANHRLPQHAGFTHAPPLQKADLKDPMPSLGK